MGDLRLMARFTVINPVSIAYLILTGAVLCFGVVLAVAGASASDLGEVLRYWFLPWTVDLSHAFGFGTGDFVRRLFLAAGLAWVTAYAVRGLARSSLLKVVASIVGIIGVIDWFALVVFTYVAMHLHY